MRIAIVTSGRFHVCDLARELAGLGHEVKFYSWVPPWRTKKFGLPSQCNRCMLPRIAIPALSLRLARKSASRELATQKLVLAYDHAVSKAIEPCDVLIGMSGMCNEVAKTVKAKYGAQVWIERSSRHILSQKEILDSIPGASKVSDFAVERELSDYEHADTITVLSKHCEESFLERGFTPHKLFRNPLGVDLNMFAPTTVPPSETPTVIMTGTWCLQKGCDTLLEAWRMLPLGTKLIHVGPVGDLTIPKDANFIHHDTVDQSELIQFYSQSHVFALISRQDGFGMVIPQALACGLPVVCSDRTGAPDLMQWVENKNAIRIVKHWDVESISRELAALLEYSMVNGKRHDLLGEKGKSNLTWSAYGQRYSDELARRFGWG